MKSCVPGSRTLGSSCLRALRLHRSIGGWPANLVSCIWMEPRNRCVDRSVRDLVEARGASSRRRIGDFTVCRGLENLVLGRNAVVGRGNWITGYPAVGRILAKKRCQDWFWVMTPVSRADTWSRLHRPRPRGPICDVGWLAIADPYPRD
jgi:hypothetical protein